MLLLALLLFGAAARAAPAAEVILLTADEQKSAYVAALEAQLGAALRAQLQELNLRLLVFPGTRSALSLNARRARDVARDNDAVAVIWLESAQGALDVLLYDSQGKHLYSRRVPPSASSAASSEEVALVLRSAIAAVIEGDAAVSMTEVTLPLPPAPAAPKKAVREGQAPRLQPARDRAEARLAAGYLGTLFTRAGPFQHGVSLAASWHVAAAPWLVGLSYTYFPALYIDDAALRTRVSRHPGELFGGAEVRWHGLWVVADGALSGDRISRRTQSVATGLSPSADSQRWLWAVSTRLGLALEVSPRVRCTLKLGAEFLLNPYEQVIAVEGAEPELFVAPLRARPRAELSLSIGL